MKKNQYTNLFVLHFFAIIGELWGFRWNFTGFLDGIRFTENAQREECKYLSELI